MKKEDPFRFAHKHSKEIVWMSQNTFFITDFNANFSTDMFD